MAGGVRLELGSRYEKAKLIVSRLVQDWTVPRFVEFFMGRGTRAEGVCDAAIDCEMVGVGPEGSESTLARVSIVNYHGAIVLDRFVRPREKVTDYRTWVSGVREEDLRNGELAFAGGGGSEADGSLDSNAAPTFVEVQKEVATLIKGRILIGHAISNDTDVRFLPFPS